VYISVINSSVRIWRVDFALARDCNKWSSVYRFQWVRGTPPSVCMRRWPDQTAHVFIYFLFVWSCSVTYCKQDIANLTVGPRNCLAG
jgi:hypothetical protein